MNDSSPLRWAVLALTGACAASTPALRRIDEPPPPIHLALDVHGHEVGLTGAEGGPMCEGAITGALVVSSPRGAIERLAVDVTDLSETLCQGCDPLPGDPHSCDNACHRAFRAWIPLAEYPFSEPGDYTFSGAELVLGCARDRTHFETLYLTVDATGMTSRIESPAPHPSEPSPAQGATPPTQLVATDTITATDVRARLPLPAGGLTGQAEGLAIPTGPHQPRRGVSETRWGELRTFSSGTPYLFITGDHGPYWISTRADPSAASLPFALDGRPHILSLVAEDATDEARRASQSGGVVASAWRPLDDPAQSAGDARAVTLDVLATLDDASSRWDAFVASQRDEVMRALASAGRESAGRPFGRETTAEESTFAPTWMPESQRLVVRRSLRTTRSSQHRVPETVCPRNRPGPCRQVLVVQARAYHADVALELEYDRSGSLVAERRYAAHPVAAP